MRLFGGAFLAMVVIGSREVLGFVRAQHTWVHFRGQGIVKQRHDFSCGVASVATILTHYYGDQTSEFDILKDIQKKGASSFLDLKVAIEKRGYKAIGLGMSWQGLLDLKIPVIVHVNYKGQDHFSVIKNIDESHVHLADPSWGNRKLSHGKFKKIFHTRSDPTYVGAILIVFHRGAV